MEFIKILCLSVLAAIAYGILHDMFTAHICVEYFTIGHPYLGFDSPVLLAVIWGVLATWWAGLILGIPLAHAARAGCSREKLPARALLRPIAILLLAMGFFSVVAGLAGYILAATGKLAISGHLSEKLPKISHPRFLADLCTHNAAYFVGFAGTAAIPVVLWRKRPPATPVRQ